MKKQELSALVLRVTDGVAQTVTDALLLCLYTSLGAMSVRTMGDANRMVDEVHRLLDDVNYQTIKKALYNLTAKGLVTRPHSPASTKRPSALEVAITQEGRKRLAQLVPTYRTKRPWDGFLYLISYDIPSSHSSDRDMLRDYLRRTGGGMLQESLWMNPYNPTQLLAAFTRTRGISGTMLISKLGRDGSIGDESLRTLVNRVYQLEALAKRYRAFLAAYPPTSRAAPFAVSMHYLGILKDDPQLPFALEPKGFPARQAWERYRARTQA